MITVIIRYSGINGNAYKFMNEMKELGIIDKIRREDGNLRYNYYYSFDDKESIILIDSWINQEALDKHHKLDLMKTISDLRDKYDLHMQVEKYELINDNKDDKYIRR